MSNCTGRSKKMKYGGEVKKMAEGGTPMKVKKPSKENKAKFEEAQKEIKKATEFETSKGLGVFPRSPQDLKMARSERKKARDKMKSIPKDELDMLRMPESFAYGGKVKKMMDGGAVRGSRKSARKGIDGCAIKGKTRAVRNV